MPKPISILIVHGKRPAFLVAFIMIPVGESKPGIDQLHPALWVQHSPVDNAEGNIPRGLSVPGRTNPIWSLDFMRDSWSNARTFRTLNVIDDFNQADPMTDVVYIHNV